MLGGIAYPDLSPNTNLTASTHEHLNDAVVHTTYSISFSIALNVRWLGVNQHQLHC
jgi:hypothetical protein